jgi:hypothetical protein
MGVVLAAASLLGAVGCSDDTNAIDAPVLIDARPTVDGATSTADSGTTTSDAGVVTDAGAGTDAIVLP